MTGAWAWPVAAAGCAEAQVEQTLALSHRLLRELASPVRTDGTAASIHFYFALLYHCSVVRNVEAAAISREPAVLYRLTTEFYRLYFESVIRRVHGCPGFRRTPLWDAYFQRAEAWDRRRPWLGFPLLLDAAVHAHVVGDMAEAIITVCDSRRCLDIIREELFGPTGGPLYSQVMGDFAREIRESSLLPPKPFAAWLFRRSSLAMRGLMVRRLQVWRRFAVDQALLALVPRSSLALRDRSDVPAVGRVA